MRVCEVEVAGQCVDAALLQVRYTPTLLFTCLVFGGASVVDSREGQAAGILKKVC